METLPALLALICILLIITAGFIVFIKVADPLSNLIKTVINDVHATYKLGMESKKQSSETSQQRASTVPTHRPPRLQYIPESGTDDGVTTDEETPTSSTVTSTTLGNKESMNYDNTSSYGSTSLSRNTQKSNNEWKKGEWGQRITTRKNNPKETSAHAEKECESLAASLNVRNSFSQTLSTPPPSPPPPSTPPPSPPPPSTPPPSSFKQGQRKKKCRKKPSIDQQPKSLPNRARKKPSVDTCIPYKSLPANNIKERNPQNLTKFSDDPLFNLAPRSNGATLSLHSNAAQLPPPCLLPPTIVVQPSLEDPESQDITSSDTVSPTVFTVQSTTASQSVLLPPHPPSFPPSSTSLPPCSRHQLLPSIVGQGAQLFLSCSSVASQSLALSVVRRNEVNETTTVSVNNENNEKVLDHVKSLRGNAEDKQYETDVEDDDNGDTPSIVPIPPLPELLQPCPLIQSSAPLEETAWEAEEPVDATLQSLMLEESELVLTPSMLHILDELEAGNELVATNLYPFEEPHSFVDSGDDI